MNQFSPPQNSSSQQDPLFPGFPTIDVAGIFRALKEKFWLMAGICGAFIAAAIAYVMVAPKTYMSVATVEVQTKVESSIDPDGSFEAAKIDLDRLNSLASQLTNSTAIISVVDSLNLREDADFLKPAEGGYSDSEVIEAMEGKVGSELERGSRNIHIWVKDKDPERAQKLAMAFVTQAEVISLKSGLAGGKRSMELLEAQKEAQLKKVRAAEDELQKLREAHPTMRLDDNSGFDGVVAGDLAKLMAEARRDRVQSEAELAELEEMGVEDPEALLNIGSYSDKKYISDLLGARAAKAAEFRKIREQFRPGHPTYLAFENDLEGLNEQIRQTGLEVAQLIRKRVDTARKHEDRMQEEMNARKADMLKMDSVLKEFRGLQRNVNAAWEVYHNIVAKLNTEGVEMSLSDQEIKLTDAPLVNHKPIAPKKKVTVILAGMLGGMVSLGVVLFTHFLDRSLKTRRQTESTLGLTVMAEIPQAFEENWDLKESLFVTRDPTSLAAEGFRALRTSLSALSPRSVMVTSATPEDGKSFCAANLALLQAQFGYRTLLVDADFRRPSLAKALLDPSMGTPQAGALSVQNICQPTPYENLWLITCSQFAPNGSETMSGEHFAAMLWEAYRSFDCVIIDSSPVGVVSDALDFARFADAVLPVIRSGVTQTGDAQRMIQQLRRMRAPLAGCILNGVKEVSQVQTQYHEDYQPMPRHSMPALSMTPAPQSGSGTPAMS